MYSNIGDIFQHVFFESIGLYLFKIPAFCELAYAFHIINNKSETTLKNVLRF